MDGSTHKPSHSYLRDWIYGGIDGAITTFAIVAGVVGAALSSKVIIILGLANVVADGFSMAAGNYMSTKSEIDEYQYYARLESQHIKDMPEQETEEIRIIFRDKGFSGEQLERAVATVTQSPKQWRKTLLREKHGLPFAIRSPWLSALSTFSAFIICGLIPLLPFILLSEHAFNLSILCTALTFFIIGSIKSYWSLTSWWRSGSYTLLLGSAAAAMAYWIGHAIVMLI